jgi:trk system potassium uptake protein TrkA
MKRVGIIGAGRFGLSLAEALAETGIEVLLIDRNNALVQNAIKKVTWAVQCDATSANALESAGISECDTVVVAIGSNVEASMLVTANCKELGIKTVISKATSEIHGKILDKLGADHVVYPDRESAHRLARNITEHNAYDLLEISEGLSLAEIDVPEACVGKTLAEADLRKKSGVTVLCIRRPDPKNNRKPLQIIIPNPNNDAFEAEDKLIVFGTTSGIDALSGKA